MQRRNTADFVILGQYVSHLLVPTNENYIDV